MFIEQLVDVVGAQRVVYGSDYYSMMPPPRTSGVLGDILESDLSDGDKADIVSGNIRRILHLGTRRERGGRHGGDALRHRHHDPPLRRVPELVADRGGVGFDMLTCGDSQSLWAECFTMMTFAAVHTERPDLAITVSNPMTRHPAVISVRLRVGAADRRRQVPLRHVVGGQRTPQHRRAPGKAPSS